MPIKRMRIDDVPPRQDRAKMAAAMSAGAGKAGKGQKRCRDTVQPNQHDHGRQRRAAVDAEQPGIGQRIAQHRLGDDARRRKRQANQQGDQERAACGRPDYQ